MKLYDKDIRKVLLSEFMNMDDFISDPTTIVINELDVCFGVTRIDLAVINGKMHGFEIKSERDNLDRLPSQAELYSAVFDTLTIVVSEKHLSKTCTIVPEWWGIYCVTEEKEGGLEQVRPPMQNNNIDPLKLTQLLWRDELLELLRLNGITKGVKSNTRLQLCKKVVSVIEKNEIKKFVRDTLKSRESWKARPLQQLCDGLLQ